MIDKDFLIYLVICGFGLIYLVFYLIYNKKRKNISAKNSEVLPTDKNPVLSYNNKTVEIDCTFCHNKIKPFTKKRVSTAGVIMIIVGLIFTPVLIGIVFIIIGISMKVYEKYCPKCNMKLQ